MATNLALDDKLIEAAVKAGGHRTKREAVNAALREYLRLMKRREAIQAMGMEDPGEVDELPTREHFDHSTLRRASRSTRAGESAPRRARKSA